MYISYNWLKDFVKIPAKFKAETVANELTQHTVEVEGVSRQSEQFDKVVVAKVLEVKKHPNADRLRLTVVDVNNEKLNIVCGAPNVSVGQFVPVALVGAKLPNGVEIKKTVIRGEESKGMICAEDELGLGKDHEGILVLDGKTKIGEAFSQYLKINDIIFEVDNKSLSNRPDLLNHYGLARELAAILDLPLQEYSKFIQKKWNFSLDKKDKLAVKVEAKDICRRYLALKIENIEVKESPAWLKSRLIAINQKPINNIVDLSNYVMFDCGQPLHTFDAAKVNKIVVRRAKNNEVIETLDEKERILNNDDLLITDGEKPLAIAGIMGGANSGIDDNSTSLIIESANFLASSIRKTSQKIALRTEASVRFEKSLDPILAENALFRFLTLLKNICPDFKISSDLVDINEGLNSELKINLDLNWLNNKIGQDIPQNIVIKDLKKLGFKINKTKDDLVLEVIVPSWRATRDISSREDLVEEVLRLYGYDKIISRLPVLAINPPLVNKDRQLERRVKDILSLKHSLNEVYNYSFVSEEQLKKVGVDFSKYLRLANPSVETQAILRQSLIPALIGNLKTNQFKGDNLGFFEIASVFFDTPGNIKKDINSEDFLPYQEKHLGLALSGKENLFTNLKGIISSLLKNLIKRDDDLEFLFVENVPTWADKRQVAKIKVLGEEIGLVALLNLDVSKNFNFKKQAALAEINFTLLSKLIFSLPPLCFKVLDKYPVLVRDLAFVVDEKILYNDLKKKINNFDPLIRSVELFDVYVGDKLEKGQKSLAFHVSYQSLEKTLSNPEVDEIQKRLIDYLIEKFSLRLRDF